MERHGCEGAIHTKGKADAFFLHKAACGIGRKNLEVVHAAGQRRHTSANATRSTLPVNPCGAFTAPVRDANGVFGGAHLKCNSRVHLGGLHRLESINIEPMLDQRDRQHEVLPGRIRNMHVNRRDKRVTPCKCKVQIVQVGVAKRLVIVGIPLLGHKTEVVRGRSTAVWGEKEVVVVWRLIQLHPNHEVNGIESAIPIQVTPNKDVVAACKISTRFQRWQRPVGDGTRLRLG
jgi:hypothetical protein